MNLTLYEALCCFFLYSIGGWILEVCIYSWKQQKFVNPGPLNGPWSPLYGLALVWMAAAFTELRGNYVFEFLACAIVASFLQFVSGHILERLFGRRWWDYSSHRFSIDGYVSLQMAVLWGAGSVLILEFLHPLVLMLIRILPEIAGKVSLLVLCLLILADMAGTYGAFRWKMPENRHLEEVNRGLRALSARIGRRIFDRIQRRLFRAPAVRHEQQAAAGTGLVFAEGCCFYKLVWLFFIGAFLGDVTETIFCRVSAGVWMSRSSVVWGPFSIVWGMGVVLLTAMLYRFYQKEDRYIFMAGTFLGGAYEYLCSVFTEKVFGTVFWDYSAIPFNLGGRINLLYCFFWGIAAVVWMKFLYPVFSGWIERIPVRTGKILTWILTVFMAVNMVVSSMALIRYVDRNTGAAVTEEGGVSSWLDERFPDQRMERIYPNVIIR